MAREFGAVEGKARSRYWVSELEVNPFGIADGRLIPLDGLLRFRDAEEPVAARPGPSIGALLQPQSIGIIGVSTKGANMGRIILRNILQAGFDKSRITVVRPDVSEIDGVRCVADIASMPESGKMDT